MPIPTLLVIIVLSTGELASFELGSPLEPELSPQARVDLLLADYDARRGLLYDIDPPEASDALEARLRRGDLRPSDLVHLIEALGAMGLPDAANAVEPYINNPNPAVRLAAIRTLGQLGQFSSIPLIEPYLQNPDPQFRRTALVALGKFGKPELVPQLEAASSRDPQLVPFVQSAKLRIDAIAKQNYGAFVDAVIGTDEWEDIYPILVVTWSHLIRCLSDKQRGPQVRMHAAQVIAWGRVRRASQALTTIVSDAQESPELRLQAIVALGRCRIRSSAPQLITLLNAPEQSVQMAAITSLGQLGVPAALDPLLKKWNDRDGIYRDSLRLALRRSCTSSGSEVLAELLEKDSPFRGARIYFVDPALNLFDSFRPELLDSWLLPASPSRRDAALLLAFFGRRADAAKLDSLRSDPDPQTREVADRAAKRLRASGAP